jgi:intracellular septation protein
MKILFDLFPVILFFLAYKLGGGNMFVATGVLMAATAVQMAINWIRHHKLEKMHLVTLVLVMVFGGLTLLFHDEAFIKWKVSIINWLFGIAFLASPLFSNKTLVEHMMGSAISVARQVWSRLNLSWALFFLSVGFLNLYVMKNYSSATWVDFKFYGTIGLTVLFMIGQFIYLARHIQPEEAPEKIEEES